MKEGNDETPLSLDYAWALAALAPRVDHRSVCLPAQLENETAASGGAPAAVLVDVVCG